MECHVTNTTCAEELNCDQHVFILSDNSTFPTSCNVKYNDYLCTATYNFTTEYLHNTSLVWEYVTGCVRQPSTAPPTPPTSIYVIVFSYIGGTMVVVLFLVLPAWKLYFMFKARRTGTRTKGGFF
uniref:Uncharacterized protein n=1 Tax=Clytia hemisphaerica TaxID=252671 RepID=A0A7M5V5F8_9CNID